MNYDEFLLELLLIILIKSGKMFSSKKFLTPTSALLDLKNQPYF